MNKLKSWMKKYSMQMAVVTAFAGVVISIMPYFQAYLPQWLVGVIMAICGMLTALVRIIPQDS